MKNEDSANPTVPLMLPTARTVTARLTRALVTRIFIPALVGVVQTGAVPAPLIYLCSGGKRQQRPILLTRLCSNIRVSVPTRRNPLAAARKNSPDPKGKGNPESSCGGR